MSEDKGCSEDKTEEFGLKYNHQLSENASHSRLLIKPKQTELFVAVCSSWDLVDVRVILVHECPTIGRPSMQAESDVHPQLELCVG